MERRFVKWSTSRRRFNEIWIFYFQEIIQTEARNKFLSSLADVRIPRVLFWFSWLKTDRYPDFSNHIYLLMIGWMNIVNNYHMNHMMTCHLFKVLENLPFEPFKEAISQKIWVLNHRVIESFRGNSRLWKQ